MNILVLSYTNLDCRRYLSPNRTLNPTEALLTLLYCIILYQTVDHDNLTKISNKNTFVASTIYNCPVITYQITIQFIFFAVFIKKIPPSPPSKTHTSKHTKLMAIEGFPGIYQLTGTPVFDKVQVWRYFIHDLITGQLYEAR